MRNLKRALSLALATVMTVGMMVVGTGASYADVKATDNTEAIEVLQAVGIMTGDDKGNFNPDANVTRNEIAVIMSNLLNLDYDYYRGTNPFTDVPSWAAPYVAACYAEGVTAGAGNGLYNGAGNVTAAEASLMIMKALGYFQYQNDFGDDWQIATIRQASYINLFDGINANAETALTRNQIAQLVLNGLKANMVTFTGSVGATIGDVVIGYVPEYTPITNANKKYDSIDVGTTNIGKDDQFYVQLGEELYNGDLKLQDDVDVFGRPARCWEFKGKEVGTYVNTSLLVQEYTTKVTGGTLYDLLTRSTVNDYSLTVVIDGVYKEDIGATVLDSTVGRWFDKNDINRNNQVTLGGTGNGVLTQVFVDNDADTITVAIINTYLALANKDYDAKKDEIGFNVYGIENFGTDDYFKSTRNGTVDMKALKVSGEDFNIENLAEDDAVLVTIADGEIQTMADCEVMAGTTVDAFETGNNNSNPSAPSAVEIDGTEYKFAEAAEFDPEVMEYYTGVNGVSNLKDLTYNVYMDAYGYVIGIEEVEKVNNYVFISGIDLEGSNLGARNATANAIFLDGTMKTIDIDMTKSKFQNKPTGTGNALLNTWFTYTVSTKDVYTLTEVANLTSPVSSNVQDDYLPDNPSTPLADGGSQNLKGKLAQYHWSYNYAGMPDTNESTQINNRYITVNGTDNQGASTAYDKVYGTDKTVYLTVSLDALNGDGIIDDVESVITGIGNANLEVWDKDMVVSESNLTGKVTTGNFAHGVYSLYNNDGDVIAAVVVGEDTGLSKNLVYVHSSAIYREKYDATTQQYTWSRKVISNGQEVILTEVGEGVGDLETMNQYTWYQVKYNAEGNVIEANPVDGVSVLTLGTDYVENINLLDAAVQNGDDTVLYYSNSPAISTADLKMTGKTLWLDGTATKGFRVADDVNVALIQTNNNETKTYFETGADSLKNMVTELNDRHTGHTHNFVVSAILEKGVATSVVINDKSSVCDPYKPGSWDDNKTGNLDLTGLAFTGASGLEVSYQNKSSSAITLTGATITVRVKDAETGKLLYAGPATACKDNTGATMTVANSGDYGVIVFNFRTIPGSNGSYNVELTINDGTSYTGTATLATA